MKQLALAALEGEEDDAPFDPFIERERTRGEKLKTTWWYGGGIC
jgi:hypothetical protein